MRKSFVIQVVAATLLVACASSPTQPRGASMPTTTALPVVAQADGENAATWFRAGATRAHNNGAGRSPAKNIILFVGDGMSLTTVAAARIFEGQRRGQPGEENALSFETLPYTALSKTYNTDSQTPDSAGTMSAMMTGAKTRIGMISVSQAARYGNCASARGTDLATALEIAELAGLSTGIVTTTRLTHATPGATYAHVPDRSWENDSEMPAEAVQEGCHDIARQFVDFNLGDGIDVALGGGRSMFLPAGEEDPEYPGLPGARLDGRNLVAEWRKKHPEGQFVWNRSQFSAIEPGKTRRLFGLFEPSHMHYEHDRAQDRAGEPTLAEMTRTAIAVLRQNPAGYFLMVEGGRIDHAHHSGNAYRALTDTVAFSDAVRVAMQETSDTDTLVLVTADHAHTLTFAGYPVRGNPILGKVVGASGEGPVNGFAHDAMGLPYTTLGYANGPGYAGASDQQREGPKKFEHPVSGVHPAKGRPNLTGVNTEDPDYLQEATLPMGSETHGGEDVGIWARGPGADAVRGTVEQNTIFHFLVQSQPGIVQWLCLQGDCENGVPVRLPTVNKPASR